MYNNNTIEQTNQGIFYNNKKIFTIHKVDTSYEFNDFFYLDLLKNNIFKTENRLNHFIDEFKNHKDKSEIKYEKINDKYEKIKHKNFYYYINKNYLDGKIIEMYIVEIYPTYYNLYIKIKNKYGKVQRMCLEISNINDYKIYFTRKIKIQFINSGKELKLFKDIFKKYFEFESGKLSRTFKIKNLKINKFELYAKIKFEIEFFFDVMSFLYTKNLKKLYVFFGFDKKIINVSDSKTRKYVIKNNLDKIDYDEVEYKEELKNLYLKIEIDITKYHIEKLNLNYYSEIIKLKKDRKKEIYIDRFNNRTSTFTEIKNFIYGLEKNSPSKLSYKYQKICLAIKEKIEKIEPKKVNNNKNPRITSYIVIDINKIKTEIIENRNEYGIRKNQKEIKMMKRDIFNFCLIYLRILLSEIYFKLNELYEKKAISNIRDIREFKTIDNLDNVKNLDYYLF